MKKKSQVVLWDLTTMNNVCTQVCFQKCKTPGDYLIFKNGSKAEINFFPEDFLKMAEIVTDKLYDMKGSDA